jgi:AsmA-like C-terminal region
MGRKLRKLLAGLTVLIVLVAITVVLFARGRIGGDAVRRTLESQLSSRVGEPVAIGSVGSSFFPRVMLDLHDVAIGRPVRATITEFSIATGLRGLLSRRVEGAEVIVSKSRLPVEMALGIAAASASSSAGDSVGAGLSIVSIRALSFRQVELVAGRRSLVVDLESALDGDRLDVSHLSAQSEGTKLEAHGTLTSIAKHEGKFVAAAGRLNLDELLTLAGAVSSSLPAPSKTPAAASSASPVNLQLDLTAPGGELGGYSFQTLSSTLRVTPQQIHLQPLKFGMFGGQFAGQLRVLTSGPVPDLALNGRVERVDMARLLEETQGSSPMSGTMTGTVAMAGRGATSPDVLRTAHGSGRVAIVDGAIPGLEMVRAIVLAFGKPSGAPAAGSGSRFTNLEGDFALADQALRAPNISFASRDFDMEGTAVVRLPAGAVDVRANVRLSRELTAQAGTDLRRYAEEDGRVVVPATITGTLANPGVAVDVAAAVNRALQNEVKRKLKGFLDRIIRDED